MLSFETRRGLSEIKSSRVSSQRDSSLDFDFQLFHPESHWLISFAVKDSVSTDSINLGCVKHLFREHKFVALMIPSGGAG